MEGHRDRSSWLCRVHRAILRNIICHFKGETEVSQCQCQENGLGMRKAGLLLNPQTITSHRTGVGSTANNSKAAQELRNKLLMLRSRLRMRTLPDTLKCACAPFCAPSNLRETATGNDGTPAIQALSSALAVAIAQHVGGANNQSSSASFSSSQTAAAGGASRYVAELGL